MMKLTRVQQNSIFCTLFTPIQNFLVHGPAMQLLTLIVIKSARFYSTHSARTGGLLAWTAPRRATPPTARLGVQNLTTARYLFNPAYGQVLLNPVHGQVVQSTHCQVFVRP